MKQTENYRNSQRIVVLRRAWLVLVFCAAMASTSYGQFKTLHNFEQTDGANPGYGTLAQGLDGNLYGTTVNGGTNNDGTVFKITPEGVLTTIYNFCIQTDCADGSQPESGLVLDPNGSFYGTTSAGGTAGVGTIFKINSKGELMTLHSFCSSSGCTDGTVPYDALTLGTDGSLYGTTYEGGSFQDGTVFKITPAGTFSTLYSFSVSGGIFPYAGLVQGNNGNFYGTTYEGGSADSGTVFEITPAGTLTTLCNLGALGCPGGIPSAALVQASNGDLYGTTTEGTTYKMTPAGTMTAEGTPPGVPYAGFVQATNNELYGTTAGGGTDGAGTVFEMTLSGTVATKFSFDYSNGDTPRGGLVQATNGILYGTTAFGGSGIYGTVFSLSVGLTPFVKTLPGTGKAGATVIILGNNLTSATAVTFNGTPATFTVVSSTEIRATLPAGATTGTVEVTTSGGTLSSNVPFRVR